MEQLKDRRNEKYSSVERARSGQGTWQGAPGGLARALRTRGRKGGTAPGFPGPCLRCNHARRHLPQKALRRLLWVPGRCPYLEQTRSLACGQSGGGASGRGSGPGRWPVHPPGPTSHPRQPGLTALRPRLPALALTWRRHDLREAWPFPHCPSPPSNPGPRTPVISAGPPASRQEATPPPTRTLCNGGDSSSELLGPQASCRWATGLWTCVQALTRGSSHRPVGRAKHSSLCLSLRSS